MKKKESPEAQLLHSTNASYNGSVNWAFRTHQVSHRHFRPFFPRPYLGLYVKWHKCQ